MTRLLVMLIACLLYGAEAWGCTCASPQPFCKLLAAPGAKLNLGPGTALFVGRAVYSQPASYLEAERLERQFFIEHPEWGGANGTSAVAVRWEGRKQFWLSLWGEHLSPESRARLARLLNPGKVFGLFYSTVALSRIKVIEAFAGDVQPGDEVEMFGSLGSADCSFQFKEGSEYLVVAHETEHGFRTTGICSRSQEIKGPNSDLVSLRAWRDRKPLDASLTLYMHDITNRGHHGKPLTGFPLRLIGPGEPIATVTDRYGRVQLEKVTPGSYRIETSEPGWTLRAQPFELLGGCADIYASATQAQSVVTGLVARAGGGTVGPLSLTLEPVSAAAERKIPLRAEPDRVGVFRFAEVEPGDYYLAITGTPFFYPGVPTRQQAAVLHVARGVDFAMPGTWVLPAQER